MREKRIYKRPAAPGTVKPRARARPVVARRRHPVLRVLPLLLPLVLVNAAAVWGQAGWAYERVTPRLVTEITARIVLSLLFALSIESIGVYLSWEAHMARMNNEAAGLLQAGAYAVGGLAGWLNFDHWHVPGGDNSAAIVFALLSAISPWLWAVWSRARNRARLAELGMTDPRGVKLSTSRKFWHPILSLRVVRWAAWSGEVSPTRAVAGWEHSRRPAPTGPRVSLVKVRPSAPAVTHADLDALFERFTALLAAQKPRPERAQKVVPSAETSVTPVEQVARGWAQKRRQQADAIAFVRAEWERTNMSVNAREVGQRFGMSESWGREILKRAVAESPNGHRVDAGL